MKKRTVFKLLDDLNGIRFQSWSPPGGCTQEYFLDRINRPKVKGSGMFVFLKLKEALEYDKLTNRCRAIFKCEATGVRRKSFRLRITSNLPEVEIFWKDSSRIPDSQKREVKKTVFVCSTLKIVERIL